MKNLVLVCVVLTGCVGREEAAPPPPPPPPFDAGTVAPDAGTPDAGTPPAPDAGAAVPDAGTPDAGPPVSMVLTVKNGAFVLPDGGAADVRGAVSCCGGGYGWPLYDEAWSSLVAAKGGTFLHMRLGPFRTEGNGETDWAPIGGGYVEANGKADLTKFNEAFWARVRALLQHARDRKLWVEVDVIDGWGVKHCQAGDIPGYSAWDPAFNAQGVDHCAGAGSAALVPGSVHERWVKKVVEETGRFDNVVYEDGNEVGLVGGYKPAWTKSIATVIRAEEAARGYVRHPFGTNAGIAAAMQLPEVDYLQFHQKEALSSAQCFGKPCFVNEYNPNPALTPAEFQQRFCSARQQGTSFWYWRHGQTAAQMDASLTLLGSACPAVTGGCSFPQGVPDPGFIAAATSNTDTDPAVDAAVNAAMVKLTACSAGSSCSLNAYPGTTAETKCQAWFQAVTAELRSKGFCAGQHELGSTDEIAVSNTGCAGKWYGYHVCNYGGPLVVWNPGARRGWWQISPSYCP